MFTKKLKNVIFILILAGAGNLLYAQSEIIVQRSDADSLWQLINEVYTLEENVIVITCVGPYGFVMRKRDKEYLCTTSTMPEEFWIKIRLRKRKFI